MGYWLSVDNNNISYTESSEWDETEEVELYEESAGEVVLRSERESFLSDYLNRGISHEPLLLSNNI